MERRRPSIKPSFRKLFHPRRRTWALAGYNVVIDAGHATGALAALLPSLLMRLGDGAAADAHRAVFVLCAAITAAAAIPYAALSSAIEIETRQDREAMPPVNARSRQTIARLAMLFGLDSLGGGFLSTALIAYWFTWRFGVSEAELAILFAAARVLNAASHVLAAWLAQRIGLLNTMVWTHLPSSVLLLLTPAAPNATAAAILFLAREALVEMDVPTRQSYVMAVVPPSQRTLASGVTNVTRNVAWTIGPLVAGVVMQYVALAGPLLIGGAMKIAYDLMLYAGFRHVRPLDEERLEEREGICASSVPSH